MIKAFLRKLEEKINPLASYDSFDRPIFIISPPRSGSTFLFDCLTQLDELYHLGAEADLIWWRFFPYENMKDSSDYIGIESASAENIQTIRKHIYNAAIGKHLAKYPGRSRIPYLFGVKHIRYLDKTIANCFHLEFMERAFPNAQYVFLVRDPRDAISSMIEGWPYVEHFGKSQLTSIVQSSITTTIKHWTYPAPPGWQDIISRPLPQICAWSWKKHIEYPLDFFNRRNNPTDVIWVRYENLVDDAVGTTIELVNKLELKFTRKLKEYAAEPPLSRTTVSKPRRGKWMSKHYKEIVSILPMIDDTAGKIGYDVSLDC